MPPFLASVSLHLLSESGNRNRTELPWLTVYILYRNSIGASEVLSILQHVQQKVHILKWYFTVIHNTVIKQLLVPGPTTPCMIKCKETFEVCEHCQYDSMCRLLPPMDSLILCFLQFSILQGDVDYHLHTILAVSARKSLLICMLWWHETNWPVNWPCLSKDDHVLTLTIRLTASG